MTLADPDDMHMPNKNESDPKWLPVVALAAMVILLGIISCVIAYENGYKTGLSFWENNKPNHVKNSAPNEIHPPTETNRPKEEKIEVNEPAEKYSMSEVVEIVAKNPMRQFSIDIKGQSWGFSLKYQEAPISLNKTHTIDESHGPNITVWNATPETTKQMLEK